MRIKAIYIKNLKMSEGKVAAQVAHAVKNLGVTPVDCDIIVLGVSANKFNELTSVHECYIQKDKGLTEVESGTATAAAWIDVPSNSEESDNKSMRERVIYQSGYGIDGCKICGSEWMRTPNMEKQQHKKDCPAYP